MSKQPLPEGGVPFTDILGYDGYMQTEGAIWQKRTYYAVTDHGTFPIAESFGFEGTQDWSVDLDNKDWKELAANVQFGGDGHRNVFVYQRRGDTIWRGTLDLTGLPNHDNWGANSVTAEYDPEQGVFRVRYAQKGTKDFAVLETRGLGRFVFSKYQP